MLVSVIMPCFNCENYIASSIESVLNQSYIDWELLICDDGSTDQTTKILERYEKLDKRITILSNKYNKGAAGARNSCMDRARGRFIAFLDADDLWLPNKLKEQIDFMIKYDYSFTYSYYENVDMSGKFISTCMAPNYVNKNRMKFSNFIGCLTAVYDSSIHGKVKQPEIKKRNDFALWLKILSNGKDIKAYCYPKVTSKYRVNNYGLSSNKASALKFFRICLLNFANVSIVTSYIYTFFYLLIIFIKKKLPFLYNLLVRSI